MEYKITELVRIREQQIFLNNRRIFSEESSNTLPEFLKVAYKSFHISYPKFHKMDELSKLGILATELLFRNQKIPGNTALVFSNYSSSIETDKVHQCALNQVVSPSIFVYTLPNIVMGEICIKNKIFGENAFFITENFDAHLIYEYSRSLLDSLAASAIVCGWIELKNAQYDVFLCLVTREGAQTFSAENLEVLYNFENE